MQNGIANKQLHDNTNQAMNASDAVLARAAVSQNTWK